mmetsp:Transcript_956/g.1491  ORF Transcript_956/g.1491 Transcript_956/m.1491 type:complete len:237 (+) Transcript_956:1217-1927(+)
MVMRSIELLLPLPAAPEDEEEDDNDDEAATPELTVLPRCSNSSLFNLAISNCNASTEYVSFLTATFLISLARCANLSVEIVSEIDVAEGVTVATKQVLELPPQLSRSKNVSLESRNGTCLSFPFSLSTSELITCPKHNNELLIILASFKRSPAASVVFCLSLPAKSTNVNLDSRTLLVPSTSFVMTFFTVNTNTAWDRDDTRFILVDATRRLSLPTRRTSMASTVLCTSCSMSPST